METVKGRWSRVLWIASVTVAALACSSPRPAAAPEPQRTDARPEIEDGAVGIVRAAARRIREAATLRVTADVCYDVVQDTGQKLEFGSRWTATVERPRRARLESQRRDGERTLIVLDGNDLWMYSPDQEVWATEPQPGDVDASFNYLLNELGVSSPLSSLFSPELGDRLVESLTACSVVGEEVLEGRRCTHVAARTGYADFEMWIEAGAAPLLRRLVIGYPTEEGRPRYEARFTEWSFDWHAAAGTFVFQPPAGTERIRLSHPSETGEE